MKPTLFIITGLVGSGKSVMAEALAGRLGLVVISSDVTRKRLASVPEMEHRFEEFDTGIYTPEFSRKTYDTMFAEAKNVLSEGGSVIIDASFIKSGERLMAKKLAERSPMASKCVKMLVNRGIQIDLPNALQLEKAAVQQHYLSEDFKEGVTAFIEKRKPNFPGS